MSARPMTARRARTLAGRRPLAWNYEKAIRSGDDPTFHRLEPDAIIGTLRCGGDLARGASHWMHVDRVAVENRCGSCYS
ncbi:MAG TPA: hypothetical protein VNN79_21450 [Actinomycetota bacterium]|nr:hypothetical protein [Actinomycetota bacterium]